MMQTVIELLRAQPELALFLCLAVGYWIGGYKIGKFGLGTVVGTLVTALIIGQAGIELPAMIKTIFFSLFMFATGYHVGPQFFSGLRKGGLQMVVLSLVFVVVGVVTTLVMAQLFGFDQGFAAGLFSGALTQSSVIGTASDAILLLDMDADAQQKLASHVPIADAVTYLFGTAGAAILLSKVLPFILRFNLAEECDAMEKTLGAAESDGKAFNDYVSVDIQAYRIENPELVGKPVSVLEQRDAPRIYVQRMRRHHRIFTPRKELTLRIGDVVVLSGSREELLKRIDTIGPLVVDQAMNELPLETASIVITEKFADGKTVKQIADELGDESQGVHLQRMMRQENPLPKLPNTIIERGDIIDLVGRRDDIERVAARIGYIDGPSDKSDLIFIAIACVVGTLVGLLSVNIGNIALSLGASGGILVTGLLFGWLHSRMPKFGRVPPAAIWIMETLGLNVFVAAVGLAAAPHALAAMQENGLQLFLAGAIVTTIPHLVSGFFGRYVLRMNGGVLMGALAGAGTVVAALQAIQDDGESSVPALGFTVPYALNNVLLTACGPLIVALV